MFSFLADQAVAVSNRCASCGECLIGWARWWFDVSKWLDGRCEKPFAKIREERRKVAR
ncbi:hypothetical protein [Bradyrhizobium sp. C9]|uniref:hypothetical protein n=1 Tax=Bradyrhizobium sp. C9 TaxID=142585 RepID=UPI0013043B53|nr:hypothetical protein [Bradyrhizobium sp. C9]